MRGLCPTGRAAGLPNILVRLSVRQRCVHAHYRVDGTSATAPTRFMPAGLAQLDGLTLTVMARPNGGVLEGEPLQALTRLAASNQSCQVLEAISKTALVLRDTATAASRGTSSPHSADVGMQALFQNGYDTLVALLQALPQCSTAYGPAAVIPETCVTLFHTHNLLLQAAYASQQEFEVWTELMQAGLELYLRKAPRHLVTFSDGQFEPVLDAMAHQDLWRFQHLLWLRLLPNIHAWDSIQDLCSVIQGCELSAQAATTAAAAAASTAAAGPPLAAASAAMGGPRVSNAVDLLASWSGDVDAAAAPAGDTYDLQWPAAGPSGQSDMPLSTALPSFGIPAHQPAAAASAPAAAIDCADYICARSAPATAAAASVLYDKQAELAEYNSLMSECIRAALEGASMRGLAAAPQPHAAAQQLLEAAAAFDARQRSPSALAALRYTFIPSPDWLTRVAAAGVQAGERLCAAQVMKLLQDLDELAPKPIEGHGAPNRWLGPAGQAAVEAAVLRHTSSHAWPPQQTVSVIKALHGKCSGPPGEQMCGLMERLLLACDDARQDVGLLCAVLQEAVDLASTPRAGGGGADGSNDGCPTALLSSAHMSLVRVALNRAVYLVGSCAPGAEAGASSPALPSTSGRIIATGTHIWRNREFVFERYPRLLQAARRFGYPLQAFRLEEYAEELYNHLATSPGHELVAVGPEGLALVLDAVASAPCCRDPQWAAAFERACLTLVAVQFSVGYTHPKRWLGLLEATVGALPFPMPDLAAGVKALVVRLCDTRRHAKYFWQLLPLVGTLERRAAAAAAGGSGRSLYDVHYQHHSQLQSPQGAAPLWTPLQGGAASRHAAGASVGAHRNSAFASARRAAAGPATAASGSSGGGITTGPGVSSLSGSGGPRPVLPPPDISEHHVSDEEYARWAEDLGQRLALSMACLSDQDRVAQLSVLGIGSGRS